MEKKISQKTDSIVKPYRQNEKRNIQPVKASTSGYLKLILFLQKWHLPLRYIHDKRGMLWISDRLFLQLGQNDLGKEMVLKKVFFLLFMTRGIRWIKTLKKLPNTRPNKITDT